MKELDTPRPKPRRRRADALRNREQILRAATDLVIEKGPATPMELVARRAGVGIATLYRHFPDRSVLLREVALYTLRTSAEEARSALAEEPDGFTALARYMHDSIDLRIGAVMPLLADRIPMDDEVMEARRLCREAHGALAVAAHEEGSLRPDVTAGDIGLLIIRFSAPVPGAGSAEDELPAEPPPPRAHAGRAAAVPVARTITGPGDVVRGTHGARPAARAGLRADHQRDPDSRTRAVVDPGILTPAA